MTDDAAKWLRLFNRLDKAIASHRASGEFPSDANETLWAAHERVLREACERPPGHALEVVPGPRQWLRCSCGWASPDLAFPTKAEALAWGLEKHVLSHA